LEREKEDKMTDIKPLSDLLNWKLLAGTHEWPGPDGGTCINEAAIVAAGFAYRSIRSPADCPPCFCPILSAYLIKVNDIFDDASRQKLIKFIPKLPGSYDSSVAWDRHQYILKRTHEIFKNTAYPYAIRVRPSNFDYELSMQRAGHGIQMWVECQQHIIDQRQLDWDWASDKQRTKDQRRRNWDWASDRVVEDILVGAFAIGKQADPIEVSVMVERMNKVKRQLDPAIV
jgi:hypothetical protein